MATGDLDAQLETQRQWLSQAGVTASPSAPVVAPVATPTPVKKPTTAWVRADS